MMRKPKISVVMSVYNGERYLREAVESILEQTFRDFEFIIINDGSTDSTSEILESYRDTRLRIFRQNNMGLTKSLNKGIRLAQGEYIARMDADDISEPLRLEQQVKVLDHDVTVALVASWYAIINETGDILVNRKISQDMKQLAHIFKKENPLCHGTVTMRKKVVEVVGYYDENLRYAQDYELWLSMLHDKNKFYVVPEVLYRHRVSPDSVAKVYTQRTYAAIIKNARGERQDHLIARKAPKARSLSQKQKRALYHYAIATWKLEDGQTKDARRELVKSIQQDPFNPRFWYRLGLSLLPVRVRASISNRIGCVRDYLLRLIYREREHTK